MRHSYLMSSCFRSRGFLVSDKRCWWCVWRCHLSTQAWAMYFFENSQNLYWTNAISSRITSQPHWWTTRQIETIIMDIQIVNDQIPNVTIPAPPTTNPGKLIRRKWINSFGRKWQWTESFTGQPVQSEATQVIIGFDGLRNDIKFPAILQIVVVCFHWSEWHEMGISLIYNHFNALIDLFFPALKPSVNLFICDFNSV